MEDASVSDDGLTQGCVLCPPPRPSTMAVPLSDGTQNFYPARLSKYFPFGSLLALNFVVVLASSEKDVASRKVLLFATLAACFASSVALAFVKRLPRSYKSFHRCLPLLRTASHQFVLLCDCHVAGHALISALAFLGLGLCTESVRAPLFPSVDPAWVLCAQYCLLLAACLLSLVFIDSIPGLTTVAFALTSVPPSPLYDFADAHNAGDFKKYGTEIAGAAGLAGRGGNSAAVVPVSDLHEEAGAYEVQHLPATLHTVDAPHVIDVVQAERKPSRQQKRSQHRPLLQEGRGECVVVDVPQQAEREESSASADKGGVESALSMDSAQVADSADLKATAEAAIKVGGSTAGQDHPGRAVIAQAAEGEFFDADAQLLSAPASPCVSEAVRTPSRFAVAKALFGDDVSIADTEDYDDLESVGTESSMGMDPGITLKKKLAMSQFHHMVTQLRQRAVAAMEAAERDRQAAAGEEAANEPWRSPSPSPFNSCASTPMGDMSPSPFGDGRSSSFKTEAQLMAMFVRRTAGLAEVVDQLTALGMQGKVASWLGSDEKLARAVLFHVQRTSNHIFEQFLHRVLLPVQRSLPALLPSAVAKTRFLRLWMPVVAAIQLKRSAAMGDFSLDGVLPPRARGKGKETAIARRAKEVREVVRASLGNLSEEEKGNALSSLSAEQAAWVQKVVSEELL